MKDILLVPFFLLNTLYFVGCKNPTAELDKSQIGRSWDGLNNLDEVEGIVLIDPESSPHALKTPTIRLTGLKSEDIVSIYRDADCSDLLIETVSEGDQLDITLPVLRTGGHLIHAKRRWTEHEIESPCSEAFLLYEVSSTDPFITGLSDDPTIQKAKTWTWGCSGTRPPCSYRFTVNTNSIHVFNSEPYGDTTTLTQNTGTGIHYLHIQAKDQADRESSVLHFTTVLDNSGPSVSGIDIPTSATYTLAQNLDFTVNFDENVTVTGTPRLSLTVGTATRFASYASGSGTSALVFRYTVQSPDDDPDGIALAQILDLNSGTLRDSLGNNAPLNFSSPSLDQVKVDTVSPTLTGLADDTTPTQTKSWTWGCSETCTYRFTVDTSPSTDPSGTYGSAVSATQGSGTGTYYLHVQARDEAGNESAVVHVQAVLDNSAPSVSSVNAPTNGTYRTSQNLDFTLNFDKNITVTGTPRLSLTVGSSARFASYASGSGTSALVFRYTVQTADNDPNGIAFASTTIDLNSGTLQDSLSNDASLSFSPPSLANVKVDAVAPTVTGLADDATPTQTKNWTWGCSETCTYRF
ncbi:MAG: hypothetical protein OXB88_05065, partial [Bacteriovoracales bacterium]|nr:hypothetical protein [Bacteriovoracales bacterium]